MVIGSGMMAKVFELYQSSNEVLIFASGVSNSKAVGGDVFLREELLLKDTILKNPGKLLIYFSTCSVYDDSVNKTPYVIHKVKMENLIKRKCSKFYIFRLSQVVGLARNQTFINYLFTSIQNNKKIDIYKYSTRNLISTDDALMAVSYLVKNKIYFNEITNIATPNNILVMDIVKIIEDITKLSFNYNLLDCGEKIDIDIEKILNLNMNFDFYKPKYLENILLDFFNSSKA